jgi:hypothetical protein
VPTKFDDEEKAREPAAGIDPCCELTNIIAALCYLSRSSGKTLLVIKIG